MNFAESLINRPKVKPLPVVEHESNASKRNRIEAAKDSIIRDLDKGHTGANIAKQLGFSASSIYAAIQRWEYKRTTLIRASMLARKIADGSIKETVTVKLNDVIVGTYTPVEEG